MIPLLAGLKVNVSFAVLSVVSIAKTVATWFPPTLVVKEGLVQISPFCTPLPRARILPPGNVTLKDTSEMLFSPVTLATICAEPPIPILTGEVLIKLILTAGAAVVTNGGINLQSWVLGLELVKSFPVPSVTPCFCASSSCASLKISIVKLL